MARLGTPEDPGCEPDSRKVFARFGRQYTIDKYDRRWSAYGGGVDENYIRPYGFVNSYRELYQQNDKYVWVWQPVPEPQQEQPKEDVKKSTESTRVYTDEEIAYLQYIRGEFAELTPKDSGKSVRFEESSAGLPRTGSWRNHLAVGDMNGDGFPDLVVPPQRQGNGAPAIFLGNGKGQWTYWADVKWPHGVDYGGVAVADFNKDGNMDVAFAVHLQGVFVFLGDGKGNFTEVTKGLPRDFATRRIIATDVDGDGYPDLVVVNEGATGKYNAGKHNSGIQVLYNRDKGTSWEAADVSSPKAYVASDFLSTGDFNGDKRPDFVAGDVYFNSADMMWMSNAKKGWSAVPAQQGHVIPAWSYYFANATGRFTSKKTDDAVMSYVRFWPPDVNPKLVLKPDLTEMTGLDLVTFSNRGKDVKRTSIARWAGKVAVTGMAAADFDGDGNLDVAYTFTNAAGEHQIAILLGDGHGNFTRATVSGIRMEPNTNYDVKVADLNGDGRPDIILMYEPAGSKAFATSGSVRVFLNRGAGEAQAAAAK